ncbi:MAG: hypothetical protein IJD30_03460, partial [Clostridia bacterium]|nr:hypothetical protein [Clostridia bacterium]
MSYGFSFFYENLCYNHTCKTYIVGTPYYPNLCEESYTFHHTEQRNVNAPDGGAFTALLSTT